MSKKTRVGIVFGGRSGEHEVSLRSARSVMEAIDRSRFEVVPIGISRGGHWVAEGDPMDALERGADARLLKQPGASGTPRPAADTAGPAAGGSLLPPADLLGRLDVVFPVLHGPYGEDGTFQGLLEMLGIPYVGAGVAASALAMDKLLFKDVARAHGLPSVAHRAVDRSRWEREPERVLEELEKDLGYPVFTKPANLGSSVGIRKCQDRAALRSGLAEAARFDRRLLVEVAVPRAREIEVSILGNDAPVASVPGEIVPSREFYDYAAKYLDEGDRQSRLLIPAPLEEEMAQAVQDLAVRAYRVIDCAGLARADFLLNGESGELLISELNTLPGFTSISMYPKLWEATGLAYPDLITRLIELGLERAADRRRTLYRYEPEPA